MTDHNMCNYNVCFLRGGGNNKAKIVKAEINLK